LSDEDLLALLTHLDTTYGTITADDLTANLKALDRVWSTEQPIKDLWLQLRACRVFAATRDPITEATAVGSAIKNLENTGVFIDALKEWRRIPDADRTSASKLNSIEPTPTASAASPLALLDSLALPPSLPTRPQLLLLPKSLPAAAAATAERRPPSGATGLSTLVYCWSHGLGPNPDHTSPLCRHKTTPLSATCSVDATSFIAATLKPPL
jgi:hypothetical protein